MTGQEGWFLGVDASTQGIKALVVDVSRGEIVASASVNFGKDLPEYGAPQGFMPHADERIRHANPVMWVAGLELALVRLRETGVDMRRIAAVSGSGQQHGSVYCKAGFEALVAGVKPREELVALIPSVLSRATAPIWMDKSTSVECEELWTRFGERVKCDTGSPPIERFTGPQIRKFAKEEPDAYGETASIHMVSSFLCSLLVGGIAPIDYGDGAGMNLLNLRTLSWDAEIVEFTAKGLLARLPDCVPSSRVVGYLAGYWGKFGLRAQIPVVAWSGDNPNSLIGMGGGAEGSAVISLGTSDTLFAAMRDIRTDPDGYGHVFGNPAGGFMSLICFTNGSLARERVKADIGCDWGFFDVDACARTPAGNSGKILLPYFAPESTPLVLKAGVQRNFESATPAEWVRAVLEAQALSMRLHSNWQGRRYETVRVTGGASRCVSLLRIIADVFQSRVETISVSDSAGLGAALRAANGAFGVPFAEMYGAFCSAQSVVEPNPGNREVYERALDEYRAFESRYLERSSG